MSLGLNLKRQLSQRFHMDMDCDRLFQIAGELKFSEAQTFDERLVEETLWLAGLKEIILGKESFRD